jgi:hypothetical protein
MRLLTLSASRHIPTPPAAARSEQNEQQIGQVFEACELDTAFRRLTQERQFRSRAERFRTAVANVSG